MTNSDKKSNSFFAVIVIIVILLGVGTAVLLYDPKNEPAINTQSENATTESEVDPDGSYFNNTYSFGFLVPKGFNVAEPIPDGASESIIVNGEGGKSVQINVSTIDQEGELTVQDIKDSNPALEVSNVKEYKLQGVHAVEFSAFDAGISTEETWFIKGLQLFQVSALPDSKSIETALLKSWVFEKK